MNQDLYLHGLIGGAAAAEPLWTRPSDWLTLPTTEIIDDVCYLLISVFDTTANFLAFTVAGNYTVDWGDGSIENVASGVKAEHQYDWTDISSETLTTSGYRQALVTITPQLGSDITSLDFQFLHSELPGNRVATPIKEIKLNCPSCIEILLGEPGIDPVAWYALERVEIGAFNVSSLDYLISYCYGLKEIVFTAPLTSVVSASWGALSGNYALQRVVMQDMPNCLDFSGMFSENPSLKEVNAFDTSSGTDFTWMFNGCYSLEEVPLLDLSSATNVNEMFGNCWALRVVPTFNTSSCTNFSEMFKFCWALENIPTLDTSSGINFTDMFAVCRSIRKLPALNLTSGTTLTNIINQNDSLLICNMTNIKDSINFNQNLLDRENIINIFNNLATVVGKTISISANPGTPSLTAPDLAIATNKGWTVTT